MTKTTTVVERISRVIGVPPYCACGCGGRVASFPARFIKGHNLRRPK